VKLGSKFGGSVGKGREDERKESGKILQEKSGFYSQ